MTFLLTGCQDTQHNDTQLNDTHHNNKIESTLRLIALECHLCWVSKNKPSMLSVVAPYTEPNQVFIYDCCKSLAW
jgi:hypothetical protein